MTYTFNWPVNHVSFSPDKAMLCVVGDNKDAALLDSRSGHQIANLRGNSNLTHRGRTASVGPSRFAIHW